MDVFDDVSSGAGAGNDDVDVFALEGAPVPVQWGDVGTPRLGRSGDGFLSRDGASFDPGQSVFAAAAPLTREPGIGTAPAYASSFGSAPDDTWSPGQTSSIEHVTGPTLPAPPTDTHGFGGLSGTGSLGTMTYSSTMGAHAGRAGALSGSATTSTRTVRSRATSRGRAEGADPDEEGGRADSRAGGRDGRARRGRSVGRSEAEDGPDASEDDLDDEDDVADEDEDEDEEDGDGGRRPQAGRRGGTDSKAGRETGKGEPAGEPAGDDEKLADRRARNRDSARASRRRKKEFVESLDDRVRELVERIDRLRREKLALLETALADQKRALLLLAQSQPSLAPTAETLLRTRHGPASPERRAAFTFHVRALLHALLPPHLRFFYWLARAADSSTAVASAHSGAVALDPPSARDTPTPVQPSDLWLLLCNEIGATAEQADRLFRDLHRVAGAAHAPTSADALGRTAVHAHDLLVASNQLARRTQAALDRVHESLTPAQILRVHQWMEEDE